MKSGDATWMHGPSLAPGGVHFRLWAPALDKLDLVLEGRQHIPMIRRDHGFFETLVEHVTAGDLYSFALPDGRLVPDPASRFQPRDVHGPSEVIDPSRFSWREDWRGRPWEEIVLYELHIGAFTPEGTFQAALGKLGHLADLGVTAVEIMPVSDFSGRWNWGYDGVLPYAPDSSYGRPEDFKAFVEAAHAQGICVLLDVVYNHFGPDGNYLSSYAPDFFTNHSNPWGAAINFDGSTARPVREFFLENAEFWIEEFHLDGLRLDAVHEIKDSSRPDFLDELAARLRLRFQRPVHLILENESNDPDRLRRQEGAASKYTAQLNDDAHHVLHSAATGETKGYYAAYGGAEQLAKTLAEGFAYQGEFMPYRGRPRGGRSDALPPGAFVSFIQNHDQIGNRALGDRLNTLTAPEGIRALASLYLLAPQTPMLFMGEEWAAKTPFLFFCDFGGDLADAVRQGRRREFLRFPEFSDPEQFAKIPDPLAVQTFLSSKLDWNNIDASHLNLYRDLLRARREHILPRLREIARGGEFRLLGGQAIQVTWRANLRRLVVEANLSEQPVDCSLAPGETFWTCGVADHGLGAWSVRWSLET
jgi:maltooligosyltrehalose trehalohydrolase